MKKKEILEIIGLGLDSYLTEELKKCLRESMISYRVRFIKSIEEIIFIHKRSPQAVFFYSNRQNQKTIDDIRKIHHLIPGTCVTLISSRSDIVDVVDAFRAGVFDFLSLPINRDQVRKAIYRLKIHGAVQVSHLNPERAVLHLFSRPESFCSVLDVASAFNKYLSVFFELEKELLFKISKSHFNTLKNRLKFTDHQLSRIRRFLQDPTGLVFGLRFNKEKCFFLIKRGDGSIAYLVARNISNFPIKDILSSYLSNVLKTTLTILTESSRREEMRLLSLTDEVTGVFNQRKLLQDIDYYIAQYELEKKGFCLLFIDIDYFKNVNDQFGHITGSQILLDLSKHLRLHLRSTDLIYRYGGDEFIVLLPKTSIDESKAIALRISREVKNVQFVIEGGQNYQLSISIGVADFPSDANTSKSIIDFADKMMYMSKKNGRGKVFHINEVD